MSAWAAGPPRCTPRSIPPPERARTPLRREVAPQGLFGDECVVDRPSDVRRPPGSVSPGVHTPERGEEFTVTVWDPAQLVLGRAEVPGLRQQTLLQADEGGVRAQEGVRAHGAWQTARTAVRERGAIPRMVVATATARARDEASEALEAAARAVAVASVAVEAGRPSGAAFGTLVHALLATVELGTVDVFEREASLASLAEVQRRLLGSSLAERDAAIVAVTRALGHPLLRRAAVAAGQGLCRRETPVSVVLADGTLLEGVVDAAFFDDAGGEEGAEGVGGAWTVVDFKTDQELSVHEPIYRRQVALYAHAIAAATGQPTCAVLLRV